MEHFLKTCLISIIVPFISGSSLRQLSPDIADIVKVLSDSGSGSQLLFQSQPQVISQSYQETPIRTVTTSTSPQFSILSPTSLGLQNSLTGIPQGESSQSFLNSYLTQAAGHASNGQPIMLSTTGGIGNSAGSYGMLSPPLSKYSSQAVLQNGGLMGMGNSGYENSGFLNTIGGTGSVLTPGHHNMGESILLSNPGSTFLAGQPSIGSSGIQFNTGNFQGQYASPASSKYDFGATLKNPGQLGIGQAVNSPYFGSTLISNPGSTLLTYSPTGSSGLQYSSTNANIQGQLTPTITRPFISNANNGLLRPYSTSGGGVHVKPGFQQAGVSSGLGLRHPNIPGGGYMASNPALSILGSQIRPSVGGYLLANGGLTGGQIRPGVGGYSLSNGDLTGSQIQHGSGGHLFTKGYGELSGSRIPIGSGGPLLSSEYEDLSETPIRPGVDGYSSNVLGSHFRPSASGSLFPNEYGDLFGSQIRPGGDGYLLANGGLTGGQIRPGVGGYSLSNGDLTGSQLQHGSGGQMISNGDGELPGSEIPYGYDGHLISNGYGDLAGSQTRPGTGGYLSNGNVLGSYFRPTANGYPPNIGLTGGHIRHGESSGQINQLPCILNIPNPVPITVAQGASQAIQVTTPTFPSVPSVPASYVDNSPPTIGVLRPPSESIADSDSVVVPAAAPSTLSASDSVKKFGPKGKSSDDDTQEDNDDELSKSHDDQTIYQGLARNGFSFSPYPYPIYTLIPSPSSPIITGPGVSTTGTSDPSSVSNLKSKNRNPASSSSPQMAQRKNPFFSVNKRKHFELYQYS